MGLRYKGIIFPIIPTPSVLGARLGGTLGDIDPLSKGPMKRARKGPFESGGFRPFGLRLLGFGVEEAGIR